MVAMRDSSGAALAARRFAGLEPLGFEAGDNNWYRFVANGPTEKTDPSGQCDPVTGLAAGAILIGVGFGLCGCSPSPDCTKIAEGARNCHQATFGTDDPTIGYDVRAEDLRSGNFEKAFDRVVKATGYHEAPCGAVNVTIMVWYQTIGGRLLPTHSTRLDACGWRHVGIGGIAGEVYCCKTRNASGPGKHGLPDKDFADPSTGKPNNKCFAK